MLVDDLLVVDQRLLLASTLGERPAQPVANFGKAVEIGVVRQDLLESGNRAPAPVPVVLVELGLQQHGGREVFPALHEMDPRILGITGVGVQLEQFPELARRQLGVFLIPVRAAAPLEVPECDLELRVIRARVIREEGQVVAILGGGQQRVLGAALVVVSVCDPQTGVPGELAARIAVEQLAKPGAGRLPVAVLEALLSEGQQAPVGLRSGRDLRQGPGTARQAQQDDSRQGGGQEGPAGGTGGVRKHARQRKGRSRRNASA